MARLLRSIVWRQNKGCVAVLICASDEAGDDHVNVPETALGGGESRREGLESSTNFQIRFTRF
jgi:hypothetical protein